MKLLHINRFKMQQLCSTMRCETIGNVTPVLKKKLSAPVVRRRSLQCRSCYVKLCTYSQIRTGFYTS